jgi:hypothetical protein
LLVSFSELQWVVTKLTSISKHNATFVPAFGKFQNPFFVVFQSELALEDAFKLKGVECCLTRTCG